jgi:imidazole glycerol-phosphate synthase subunit HisH
MNQQVVVVVDYGMGNLFSVQRALETAGAQVTITSDASVIVDAAKVILPGVGAFGGGMAGLRERGLIEPLLQYARSGRPLMGICLGMQMLADASEEFGEGEGLHLIPGRVVAVPASDVEGAPLKIPNIGWRSLEPTPGADWSGTPLASTDAGTSVYLVHSFHFVPDDPRHVVAHCTYGGHRVTIGVAARNIVGFQFHPEKSGPAGLAILKQFLAAGSA